MRSGLIFLVFFSVACRQGTPDNNAINVLILFTDDQRYDTIAALGNDEIRTPNMDRLVREGTAFTHAHTMGALRPALCVPSRAMLMTGRPLFSLLEKGDAIPPGHVMMPEHLRAAGYTTFATGKWHNDRGAFVRSFGEGESIFFGGMHQPSAGGHEAPLLYAFDSTGAYALEDRRQVVGFSSTLYADAAIGFLQTAPKEPFFAYVSFTSPHDPRTPPAPYDQWYGPNSVSVPPNFMPEHPFDTGELTVRAEGLREHPRTERIVKEELAKYYGMISEVDAQIGHILDALEESGLREHTLIVFAGDNGLAVGSHGLLGKQSMYEHSMRVPLVFAGPGVPAGETRDALVYIHDIFPTISDHVGLDAPTSALGESLMPVIRDEDAASRNAIFYVYRDFQRGVRTADGWKLALYDVHGVQTSQLFNLNEDPAEVHNLADDPQHADRKASMEALLVGIGQQYNDPMDLAAPDWGKE